MASDFQHSSKDSRDSVVKGKGRLLQFIPKGHLSKGASLRAETGTGKTYTLQGEGRIQADRDWTCSLS